MLSQLSFFATHRPAKYFLAEAILCILCKTQSSIDIALPASFDQLLLFKSTTWTQGQLQSQTQRLPCGHVLVLTQMEKKSPITRIGCFCSKTVAAKGTNSIKCQLQLLPNSRLLQRLLVQIWMRYECCESFDKLYELPGKTSEITVSSLYSQMKYVKV